MFYDLWDLETGNMMGTFDTEVEALRIVREFLDVYGPEAASSFGLGVQEDDGESRVIAQESALIELASALPAKTSEST